MRARLRTPNEYRVPTSSVAFIQRSSAASNQVIHALTELLAEETIVAGMAPLNTNCGDQATSKPCRAPLITGITAAPWKLEPRNLRERASRFAFEPYAITGVRA